MRCRIACTSLVYRKVLTMSNKSLSETTTGHLVNLISNDTERFDQTMPFLPFLLIGPLKAIAIAFLVYQKLKWPGLVGVVSCVLTAPLFYVMGVAYRKFRRSMAEWTDKRVKVMNEIITGMRLIKMYGWEVPFAQTVKQLRLAESVQLMKTTNLRAFNSVFFFISTPLIMFIIISLYVHFIDQDKDPLTPANVFATLMLINVLRISVALFVPEAIKNGSECLISLARIEEFLLCEEHQNVAAMFGEKDDAAAAGRPAKQGTVNTAPDADDGSAATAAAGSLKEGVMVEVKDVACTWPGSHTTVLERLNLTVPTGGLIGIMGSVGAGKSSFLSLLIGDLEKQGGSCHVGTRPTMVNQEVWLTSDTVQRNILFGRALDQERYEAVVDACCLASDFKQFAEGDQTVIGDRGITLSGGQKARIGLARACYEGGDLFLLDDPLSAVDCVVGRHIVNKCINGLLRNTTRILVTHQHQFLPLCDTVYEMDPVRKTLVKTEAFPVADEAEEETEKKEEAAAAAPEGEAKDAAETMSKEDRMTGAVTYKTYVEYFRHGGMCLAVLTLVLVAIAQTGMLLTDVWLTRWVDRPAGDKDDSFHYRYYAICLSVLVVVAAVRSGLFFHVAIKASTSMHNSMFRALVRLPMFFFDTNPTGRILNRFSKDVGQMDELLPWIFFDCVQQILICVGSIVMVCIFNPWVLLAAAPILAFFIYMRNYFIASGREVKRLEAQNRSPLYSCFSETISGVSTIRAYGRVRSLFGRYCAVQDDHTSAFYLFVMLNRWIGSRLDLASWFFIAMATIAAVLARDEMSSGQVAVSIAYAATLAGAAQWAVRQSAELENMMTATERVRLYATLEAEDGAAALADEPTKATKTKKAQKKAQTKAWPSKGEVVFDEFSMRYREGLPLVLNKISFTVEPGMKVGVIGRTGAGKSSLMQAMFRLCPSAHGRIVIDGRDTATVPLDELRAGCSVIPQDPVLFTGTLRYNVDPFGRAASDRVIWKALEDVQLATAISSLPAKLEYDVKEGGKNFSVGQRQLICLARAILRENKVLIMDEATANVDPETDAVVQQTVRRQFEDCTVLTIAHRLNTVIDADRILVLAAGQVEAYGEPHALLEDKDSVLSKFVDQTGDESSQSLRVVASQASMRRSARFQQAVPF